jgi:hypothetical protein
MSWTTYLFHVGTGRLGPRIDVSSGSWSIDLNTSETLKVVLEKKTLPAVNLDLWLAPWWGGVALFWNDTPMIAGPIIGHSQEDINKLSIDVGGIRSVLLRRLVIPELSDWSTLAQKEISYYGYSLGTIARKVVQQVQQKPAGYLPIFYPQPDETAANDANHQRVYQSFDLGNLSCDAVLTKLSNVSRGPDIMFRPRMVSPSNIGWDMWTGTEANPRIPQAQMNIWDTTAEKGNVAELLITSSGAYQTDRVFATGAGTDKGTLIQVAEDLSGLEQGYLLLESTISDGGNTNPAIVAAHAEGNLDAYKAPLRELALTVRADGTYPMGSFWPGDLIELYTGGWRDISDGLHRARILHMSGQFDHNIKLNIQTEDS